MTITSSYWYSFRVNTSTTWREKLGTLLRRAAQRIDGRDYVAIDIVTIPPLSSSQRLDCIKTGLDAVVLAIKHELHAETIEGVMREERPDLYRHHQP